MKYALFALVVLISAASSWAAPKEQVVEDALGMIRQLHDLAAATSRTLSATSGSSLPRDILAHDQARQEAFEKARGLAEQVSDIPTLAKIAELSYVVAYPQNAEHVRYDEIFDTAFWACANKIARTRTTEAANALADLKYRFGTDGGYSLMLRELIEYQHRLTSESQTSAPLTDSGKQSGSGK